MCGVCIATIAMVCAMSVFGGFQNLVGGMFSKFDPELKITIKEGKVFDPQTKEFQAIKNMDEIAVFTEILEDNGILKYRGKQAPAALMGVSDNFAPLIDIDGILFDGEFKLQDEINNFGTIGIYLAMRIGIGAGFSYPLEVYTIKRKEKVNLSNPASSFSSNYVYISGVFRTDQEIYDTQKLIVPIKMTRELFDYESEVSSIGLKLKDVKKTDRIQSEIRNILGDKYQVQNRRQQQETTFKMMEIEKWVTFLILSFICLIAVFNVVSSLSMLIVEKKEDIFILRNMGASNKLISRIFLFEGWMISVTGAIAGVILGLFLCFIQQKLGLIKFGNGGGIAIVDAYPVVVSFADVCFVFITVLIIGLLAALYPAKYLSDKWLKE
jgi:lipoprotein-releasing system permease protein/zinc transport system substrate-binding protein